MACKTQKAFSSIEILVLLFFISAVTLGTYSLINQYQSRISAKERELQSRKKFETLTDQIISELKKDKTPGSDTPKDSFYSYNGLTIDGIHITITDLSSKINVNFFPSEIVDETGLAAILNLKAPFSTLEDKCISEGLFYTYDDVSDVLEEDVYSNYCSSYGIACFNSASQSGFEKLAESTFRNTASAKYISQKKAEFNKNKQMIQNETELKLLCGIGFDEMYPYISLKQPMNIYFVDEEVLKAVLSYKKFNLPSWKTKYDNLLNLRNTKEITVEDIKNCLGITESSPLYYYFGVNTWFWKVKLSSSRYTYTTIIFKYPEMSLKNEPLFYIINQAWKTNEKKQSD